MRKRFQAGDLALIRNWALKTHIVVILRPASAGIDAWVVLSEAGVIGWYYEDEFETINIGLTSASRLSPRRGDP